MTSPMMPSIIPPQGPMQLNALLNHPGPTDQLPLQLNTQWPLCQWHMAQKTLPAELCPTFLMHNIMRQSLKQAVVSSISQSSKCSLQSSHNGPQISMRSCCLLLSWSNLWHSSGPPCSSSQLASLFPLEPPSVFLQGLPGWSMGWITLQCGGMWIRSLVRGTRCPRARPTQATKLASPACSRADVLQWGACTKQWRPPAATKTRCSQEYINMF